jgi:hypothetical protein
MENPTVLFCFQSISDIRCSFGRKKKKGLAAASKRPFLVSGSTTQHSFPPSGGAKKKYETRLDCHTSWNTLTPPRLAILSLLLRRAVVCAFHPPRPFSVSAMSAMATAGAEELTTVTWNVAVRQAARASLGMLCFFLSCRPRCSFFA